MIRGGATEGQNRDEADGGLNFRRAKNREDGDAEAQAMAKHVRPMR